ncbi:hypothetical protein [uncultured Kordia sp.]|uniref:hypothetical protein n=1 Tax=uncultured Kordia sp. TaxID=507699 RepID=UPI002609A2C2|nr:hypothetical protein [uncultured Kordia sp.]
MQRIKGKGTDVNHMTVTVPPSEGPTNMQVCDLTEQMECTISLNPVDCHTNDGTLKTWNINNNSKPDGRSRVLYC